jgi:hypothetical protein
MLDTGLVNNVGPTRTHALVAGSSGIDATNDGPARRPLKINMACHGLRMAMAMAMAMAVSLVMLARSNDARERHNTRSQTRHATGRLIQRVDQR